MIMAIDTAFFSRDVGTVGREFVGRQVSRRLASGVVVEGVILEAKAYSRPEKESRIVSPEWKKTYGSGTFWVNSRYGNLLTNVNVMDGSVCLYLSKVGILEFGKLTSALKNAGIAPHFGFDRETSGAFIGSVLTIGDQLPGAVLVRTDPKQPDTYIETYYFDSELCKDLQAATASGVAKASAKEQVSDLLKACEKSDVQPGY